MRGHIAIFGDTFIFQWKEAYITGKEGKNALSRPISLLTEEIDNNNDIK